MCIDKLYILYEPMFICRKEFGVLRTYNVYIILYMVRGRRRDKMKREKNT